MDGTNGLITQAESATEEGPKLRGAAKTSQCGNVNTEICTYDTQHVLGECVRPDRGPIQLGQQTQERPRVLDVHAKLPECTVIYRTMAPRFRLFH